MLAKLGFQEEKKDNFFDGMGSSNSGKGGIMGGSGGSSASVLPSFSEEPACAKCCPKLTYKQRLYGFIGCAACGYLLAFIGTMVLVGGMTTANVQTFACLYVFGNFIALAATGFLLGPKAQCTKMWHPTRRYTTAFYLTMLIVVFAVAVSKQNVLLIIFLLFIEVLAGVWYAASFIPYGRKIILTFLRNTCCGPCFEAYDSVAGGGGSGSSGGFGGGSSGK